MKKMCIVAFIVAGFVVFLYLQSNTVKKAKISAKVAFINQVRGGECCQKGSYEFAQRQLELFKKHHFPATFVLRYDALVDTQFINLFKSYSNDRFEYGVFLEITPQLAKDAGVLYKGTEDRWYRAQYAYLVGYTQDERKKLIDVVMNQYKRQFGVFPKITGGWMLDTFSAEYLTSIYQIQAHEITREQWGTDGYALYGGPILSAYAPSKKWLFMPAQSEEDSLPLLVLRQTLSDPVRNYGDLTSGYTSQPNDYGRTKNFAYFKHILNQVEKYSQPIAILGLENSLEKKYQDAYEKQVEYVSQVVENKNVILPVPSVISEINDINFSSGTDFSDSSYKAFWIESQKYRVRIIQKDGSIQITDLRVFNESLSDPFFAASTGEKTAFWEIPFIFDSSKFGKRIEVNAFTIKMGELFRFFGNEDWIRERTNPVVNEQFLQEVNGITLPSLKKIQRQL